MAATGHKGIDVRQTANRLVFRASIKDSTLANVTSGTTSLYLYELQDDGTLKSYDFSDNTFKSTALTTATAGMTHRTGNNGGTNTGLWTYVLSTLTGFTKGCIYFAVVTNSSGSPAQQEREFQFGSEQGDLVVDTAGCLDATAVKVGPSGSASSQTAGDIPGILGTLNAAASSGDPGTTTTLVQYLK
jgi:hypothetical protein